ncbi:MAG TPA: Hsp33 family molecular chaperone HslO [Rhizomicrobium sp.]|jgi:molecular chaperone Hsp33|nr:Hsp33 family molecular chaperone HslO [Rhizomicrobium sp.]
MPEKPYKKAPLADFVLPFDLPEVGLRGRLVRLDVSSTRALAAHALPEPAARAVGEALALAAILGTSLKLDGRLTVQTKSDGPLDLVAADYFGAAEGKPIGLRGYGRLDAPRFAALAAPVTFETLAGDGSLAITIEPQRGGQTYQGIVALNPAGIGASAETYFAQSEQLPTVLRLAAGPLFVPGKAEPSWRAGGIMLQATPEGFGADDDWERLSSFLTTVEDIELLDTQLPAEKLLWRLFHDDEARVLPYQPVEFRCSCDTSRISAVLKSYAPKERDGLADPDGLIRARCEFCGTVHAIDPRTLVE